MDAAARSEKETSKERENGSHHCTAPLFEGGEKGGKEGWMCELGGREEGVDGNEKAKRGSRVGPSLTQLALFLCPLILKHTALLRIRW